MGPSITLTHLARFSISDFRNLRMGTEERQRRRRFLEQICCSDGGSSRPRRDLSSSVSQRVSEASCLVPLPPVFLSFSLNRQRELIRHTHIHLKIHPLRS